MLWFLRPIWRADFPPNTDGPAHWALVEAMHHLSDPSHLLAQTFEGGIFPAPNSMQYLLVWVFGTFVGTAKAGLLVMLLASALVPVGLARYLRAYGWSPWLALTALPFMYQWAVFEGFTDYVLGCGVFLLQLASMEAYLRRPTKRGAVLLAALGGLVFLAHVQAFLYFVLATGLRMAVRLVSDIRRRFPKGFLRPHVLTWSITWGVALLLLVAWWLQTPAHLSSDIESTTLVMPNPSERLAALFSRTVIVLEGDQDAKATLLYILGLMLAAFVARFAWSPTEQEDGRARWFGWVFPIVIFALLLAAPMNLGDYYNFWTRIPGFLGVLAVPLLFPQTGSAPLGPVRKGAVAALLVAGVSLFPPALNRSIDVWNGFTAGLEEVLDAAEPQTHLAYYPEYRGPTGFGESPLYRHLS
ncbi:MAG: hypothetical protein KC561_12195, partial [Myxococcales bacterium]|nr:hypothetical protein [Myxococcales bacterium]